VNAGRRAAGAPVIYPRGMSRQWRSVVVLAGVSLLGGLWQPVPAAPSTSVTAVAAWRPATVDARLVGTGFPAAVDAAAVLVADPTPDPVVAPADDTEPAADEGPVDCAKLKCVALTLDDGPVGGTSRLLDLLRRKHARVTFFVLGEHARAHPGIVRRMVAEGHAVGNHSWNHPQFWHLSRAQLRSQLARTDATLKRITGTRPRLVRPPFGQVDGDVRAVARARGQALVLWNVDPLDWKDHKASTVARRVVAHARRGSIILTHDVWPSTRHAYARIIDGLRAKGFTLVTVPELLGSAPKPGRVDTRG